MLRWRLILGFTFIAALAGLSWLDAHSPRPGLYLGGLALVATALSAGELLAMLRARGFALVAPAAAASSSSPSISWSFNAGMTGATNTPTGTPRALSSRITCTRAWCAAARGSRWRFSSLSRVVSVM